MGSDGAFRLWEWSRPFVLLAVERVECVEWMRGSRRVALAMRWGCCSWGRPRLSPSLKNFMRGHHRKSTTHVTCIPKLSVAWKGKIRSEAKDKKLGLVSSNAEVRYALQFDRKYSSNTACCAQGRNTKTTRN